MSTFLGVPVMIRGEACGNLYLTDKEGGAEFDEARRAAGLVLADWAAIAIHNARLYVRPAATRGARARGPRPRGDHPIARALGGETDLERVLELIVKRGRALVEAARCS